MSDLFHLLNDKTINEVAIHETALDDRFIIKTFIEDRIALICLFDAKMKNELSDNQGTLLCNRRNLIGSITERSILESIEDLKGIIREIRLEAANNLNFIISNEKKYDDILDFCNDLEEKRIILQKSLSAEEKLDKIIEDRQVSKDIFNKIMAFQSW